MKAIVTVGLGFGDEGKGATIDFLARRESADLVVRYCGGAQAAHNVVLPDGRSHTFSQFGSATLSGVETYLASRVILSPKNLIAEAARLLEIGVETPMSLLAVHPGCLLATRYHAWMNQLRELDRGAEKHGSCGLGIGEARSYWLRYGADAIVAEDALDSYNLRQKLTLLQDRCLLAAQELKGPARELLQNIKRLNPLREAEDIAEALGGVRFFEHIPTFKVALFEGAQGILLDEYFGFHPFTTWSTVTPRYALDLLDGIGCNQVELLGIARCYSTRHGAGPFPTEDLGWSQELPDVRNPANRWQDGMRCGPLDLCLLKYAAQVCQAEGRGLDGLVLNHLDEVDFPLRICRSPYLPGLNRLPNTLREQAALGEQTPACVAQVRRHRQDGAD